jgi:cyclopropane-fatty-acyl-phospholipid synthase
MRTSRERDDARAPTSEEIQAPASAIRGPSRVGPIKALDEDRVLRHARAIVDTLLGPVVSRGFDVRYWNGYVEHPAALDSVPFTFVFESAAALRRIVLPPSEARLADAFVRGRIDVEGDLSEATQLRHIMRARLASPGALVRLARHALALPRREPKPPPGPRMSRMRSVRWSRKHSLARDGAAIRSHYDVGNEFYALWLDRQMVYSCAYFDSGIDDLDTAQGAKLDLICRKLRLRAGELFLDIGCGWGGLVRHAVRHFGVRALGITLSPSQAALARERVQADGLESQCAIAVLDYRQLPLDTRFAKIASVGMFEHVGPRRLAEYFKTVHELLQPGGLFLNHGIVRVPSTDDHHQVLRRLFWREGFIDRYVFPDGRLVTLGDTVVAAETAGFETRDVESLREHYIRTLRLWVKRLEASREEAMRVAGDVTYRTWRLYMAGAAEAFASRQIGLAQMLFAKPDAAGAVSLPATRRDLYAE